MQFPARLMHKQSGQTPLHIACRSNNKEAVALLLQKGADVNVQDMVFLLLRTQMQRGWDSLMIAAQQGNEEVVKKLLEYRPNTNQTDKFAKKASDRAATQNICYLIQSAAIDQRISQPKVTEKMSPRSPVAGSQRGGKRVESKKRIRVNLPPEQTTVLSYYREKFMEQIALLSKKLSQKSAAQLEQVIQSELDKSESFLREIVGNELEIITGKMKDQIDQHVLLKTKLAAAKAGIGDLFEGGDNERGHIKEVKAAFPLSPSRKVLLPKGTRFDKLQKKAATKTITRLNRTIDSLIDSKEDLLHSSKNVALSPRNLPKEKQDIYFALKREVMVFVGAKMDEIAEGIAAENKDTIQGILRERLTAMEKELRMDVKQSVNDLGKTLKSRVDSVVSERVTRIQKQLKTLKESESKLALSERVRAEQNISEEPSSRKQKFLQLSDLQSSIRQLDSSYTAMLDVGKSVQPKLKYDSSMKKQNLAHTERKGRNYTERVRSLSNQSKDSSMAQSKGSLQSAGLKGNRPDLTPYYAQLSASKLEEPSIKGSQTERPIEKPPRPKYYASMQKLAEEGQPAKVDYSKVEPHNSRIFPISKYSTPRTAAKDIGEELTAPIPDRAPVATSPPHYIGDGSFGSPSSDNKLTSLLARYQNINQRPIPEDVKDGITFTHSYNLLQLLLQKMWKK
eukprot:TRINITY_DN105419_c1_g1_i1.p1 TRINITY_DN105419_c1_g1~~TRINITY_DN105419_c1_g1_i1.p1  ORF type:complete len:678 (-),score=69.86 TRINITY_DN105419_c1_g1_i1:101-2134(-)